MARDEQFEFDPLDKIYFILVTRLDIWDLWGNLSCISSSKLLLFYRYLVSLPSVVLFGLYLAWWIMLQNLQFYDKVKISQT